MVLFFIIVFVGGIDIKHGLFVCVFLREMLLGVHVCLIAHVLARRCFLAAFADPPGARSGSSRCSSAGVGFFSREIGFRARDSSKAPTAISGTSASAAHFFCPRTRYITWRPCNFRPTTSHTKGGSVDAEARLSTSGWCRLQYRLFAAGRSVQPTMTPSPKQALYRTSEDRLLQILDDMFHLPSPPSTGTSQSTQV